MKQISPGIISVLLIGLCIEQARAAEEISSCRPELRVPAGFTLEVVAAPPLVAHPVMAGFDERGRLFVADNAGENLPSDELVSKLPNCVRMLTDSDGDGRFDTGTVFADKMTFPMGALPYRGAVYVASPPYIWKFEDTDDDGIADRREKLVGDFGFIGNAADIHGCFLGPEGRIYWTDGRHGHNFVDANGKELSKGKAARIFSCRTDGSDVQSHCGGGMDNPVEIDFLPTGEMLGTVNLMHARRGDCLVHFQHGGVYPRSDMGDVLQEFRRTGPLLSAVFDFGHVAVSGTACYRSDVFGADFQNAFFVTEFNTHKVRIANVHRDGATFRAEVQDFLESGDVDFHPTDVLEDADGSLLVIDTGGWFRIGCPASQVAKPEIKGAIYRIRRDGVKQQDDPRGLTLKWDEATNDELISRLNESRTAVQQRAIDVLACRGDVAITSLQAALNDRTLSTTVRRNAIWALTRIGSEPARIAVRNGLHDVEPDVRQVAAYALGVLKDTASVSRLAEIVVDDQPQVRREAATALGQLRESSAVPALLESARRGGDRSLDHAIIYALIEIDNLPLTAEGLGNANPNQCRTALIALDQMPSGVLRAEQVVSLLAVSDEALQNAVIDILGRHPRWARTTVPTLTAWLSDSELPGNRQSALRGALMACAHDRRVQELVATALRSATSPKPLRILLLEVITGSGLKKFPDSWSRAVRDRLDSADADELRQAVHAATEHSIPACKQRLTDLVGDARQDGELRLAAAAALARYQDELPSEAFSLLLSQFESGAPLSNRAAAATALGAAELSPAQRTEVAKLVARAGPLEVPALCKAFRDAKDAAVGLQLVEALQRSPGLASQSPGELEKLLQQFPDEVRRKGDDLVARLEEAQRSQASQIDQLLANLGLGDPAEGRKVFFGQKAACSACHAVRNEGGKVGPDLTKVGAIRTKRDLVEAIVTPSATLARDFEAYAIETNSGRTYTGIIQRQTAQAVHLIGADRIEIKIDRDEIVQMAPSPLSIMPQGLDKSLSPDELRDLVAWLLTLK